MIGCKVFSQGLCEVESGPSNCEADPTVRVTDIKAFQKGKSPPNPSVTPALVQRKKEERRPSSSPSTPTPGSGSSSSAQVFFDEKGQKHIIYLFFFFSCLSSDRPLCLCPPQIHSIFSSPPSAPPRPRSSPPQIFSNGRRIGTSS
ncbi:hypothetical protein MRB53_026088 [Persea americana]|uniref:Uncharacterized protein n=1 Tax=Persea americana TaxID=3435 RepID=A0ACC2LH89_PERAE|nr:hypothetical protein MRB53_026088 [Persea americana]